MGITFFIKVLVIKNTIRENLNFYCFVGISYQVTFYSLSVLGSELSAHRTYPFLSWPFVPFICLKYYKLIFRLMN